MPVRWVTISHLTDSLAVEPARIRLEAEGIPTRVDGERMGSRSMYQVATGGVRLQVPDSLAADARIILSQTWSSLAAELDIEEEDKEDKDDEQGPLPESHSEPLSDSLSLRQSLVIFLTLGLPCLVLAYLLLRNWSLP
jgi:hypothetical protein